RRRREIGLNGADIVVWEPQLAVLSDGGEFKFHLLLQPFYARLMYENLYTRLPFVVATAIKIVDAQDRRDIGKQILFRQEVADLLGEHGRTAQPATHLNRKAQP